MKGTKIFFSEKTIVNIPFMLRLLRRYWPIVLIAFMITSSFTTYKYYYQNTVFSSEKKFRLHRDGLGDPKDAIQDLVSIKMNNSTMSEVLAVSDSKSFHESLAQKIVQHPQFSDLNFRKLGEKKGLYVKLVSNCQGNKSCLENLLASRIRSFLSIADVPGRHHTFSLKVYTTDSFTTSAFIEIATNAFIQNRLDHRRRYTSIQKFTTRDILQKHKMTLAEAGHRDLEVRLEQVKAQQYENRNELRQTFGRYQSKKLQLETLYELKMASEKNAASNDNFKQLEVSDRINRLRNSIDKLKGDINALELSYSSLDEVDSKIIVSLRQELESKIRDYEKLSQGRPLDQDVPAIGPNRNIQVEYQVASEQFKRLEGEYNNLVSNIKSLSAQRNEIESKLDSLSATSNLVDSLEKRLLQFEVAASTIAPDVSFNDTQTSVSSFKRMSLTKYFLFTFFFSLFFSIIGVFFRYMTDQRVYDSYELREIFQDISIIGNAPKFKKAS